jgi:hypothetical protein
VERTEQDCPERIRGGCEETLELVALGEPEAGDALRRGVGVLEGAAQCPKPARRPLGIPPRSDDVTEQDDGTTGKERGDGLEGGHAGRLTDYQIAVKS